MRCEQKTPEPCNNKSLAMHLKSESEEGEYLNLITAQY